jgi:7-cyano-7-deazaguanine synthase in queuosine biosynthesis
MDTIVVVTGDLLTSTVLAMVAAQDTTVRGLYIADMYRNDRPRINAVRKFCERLGLNKPIVHDDYVYNLREHVADMRNEIVRHSVRYLGFDPDLHPGTVIEKACQYNAPLQFTWSCDTRSDMHCGVCQSCVKRLAMFHAAGFVDPVSYAISVQWGIFDKTWTAGKS